VKILRIRHLVVCEQSRTKTHETTAYLSTIRQLLRLHAVQSRPDCIG
jgi:hypothetical protein